MDTTDRGIGDTDPIPGIYLKLAGEVQDPPRPSMLRRVGAAGFAALAIAAAGVLMPVDDALADDGDVDDPSVDDPSLGSATGGATVTEPSAPSAPSEPSAVTAASEASEESEASAPSAPSVSQPSATSASVASPRER